MSYCVKCGVELDEGAERCPLCGTPAWKPDETEPRYFPTKPAEVPRASRRAAAALLTAMLASVSLCCGLLNLILPTEHPWALYVAGAAVMLWIWFALPMLVRGIPIFFRLTADVAAIGIYVWIISVALHGGRWFRGLVLPMLGWACVVVFLLSFLLRDGRRSRLSSIAMCIGAVGLMAMGVEYCLDRYFLEVWQPSWSLVVLVICIGLIIPLRIVRRVPSLREAQTLQYVKPASENGKPVLTLLRRGGFCDVCLQQQPAEHHADKQCDPGGEQGEQNFLIGPLARFDLLLDLVEPLPFAEGQDLPVGLDVICFFDALEAEGKVHRAAPEQKLRNEAVQVEPLD